MGRKKSGARALAGEQADSSGGAGNSFAEKVMKQVEANNDRILPDVQELCEHFEIEEHHEIKLDRLMKRRQETFVEDMNKLWEVLENAKSPAGLLVVKMREMEDGIFVGKIKADKDISNIAKKYLLDADAKAKLQEVMAHRALVFKGGDKEKENDLRKIEKHLSGSRNPSAMVMMLLPKLREERDLASPRRDDGPRDRDDRNRGRERDGRDRDQGGRDRDRERRRSRSRDRR